MDRMQVLLDPGPVTQRSLVRDRFDHDGARQSAIGSGPNLQLDSLADGSLEFAIDLGIGAEPPCR